MTLVATTRTDRVRPLEVAGRPVSAAQAGIVAHVSGRLGPDHAALFARPAESGAFTEWHAEASGQIRRFVDLPPAEREAVQTRLGRLVGTLRGEAARLGASADEAERTLGDELAAALEIPGLDRVYLIGDQPVLTDWGSIALDPTGRGQVAPRGLLFSLAPVIAPPPVAGAAAMAAGPAVAGQAAGAGAAATAAVAAAPAARSPWTWPVIVTLAVLALLFLGVLGVWAYQRGWLSSFFGQPALVCEVPEGEVEIAAELQALEGHEQVLRRQLADLERRLAEKTAACQPAIPATPPEQPAPPPEPTPRPEPPPEPTPPPAEPPPTPTPPTPTPPTPAPPTPTPPPRAETPPAQSPQVAEDRRRVEDRGGRKGRLEFILAWDNTADLDLHVVCPAGQLIWSREPRNCGGELDIDANGYANSGGLRMVRDPVEHVTFTGNPPLGDYRVLVRIYPDPDKPRPSSSPYRLTVLYDGEVIAERTGSISNPSGGGGGGGPTLTIPGLGDILGGGGAAPYREQPITTVKVPPPA